MTEQPQLKLRAAEGVGRVRSQGQRTAAAGIAFFALACGTSELDVIERLPASATLPPSEPTSPGSVEGPSPEPEPGVAPEALGPMAAPDAGDPGAPTSMNPSPAMNPPPAGTVSEPAPPEPSPPLDLDAGSPCDTAIVPLNLYRFRSRASDRCLAAGNAGFDGYDVILVDCSAEAASWQLIASSGGAYELRNVLRDYNVDIEFGNVAQGSNVVLFAAPGGPSQKFYLTELADGSVAINPRSAATELCIQADADGVRLELCIVGEPTQKWYIDPDDCMPG